MYKLTNVKMKRIVSLMLCVVLCVVLCVSFIPVSAFAIGASLENFGTINLYRKGQFSDVGNGAWYEASVEQVYNLGLMTGNSATTFNPTGKITQAEALTIAARIHKIYSTGSDDFSHIKQEMQDMAASVWEWCLYDENNPAYKEFYSAWYASYTYYLYSRVWPEGRGYYPQFPALAFDSGSAPFIDTQTPITREIFVSYLIGALPESELQQINTVEDGGIPDVTYADNPDVYLLYRAGILTGSDSYGTFAPTSNITRAEVAAIIARMVEPSLRKSITLKNNVQNTIDNVDDNLTGNATGIISVSDSDITIQEATTLTIDVDYDESDYPDGISLNAEYDSSVVEIEWGEWDDWTIQLGIIPIQKGTATVRISVIENPSEYQDIIVTVGEMGNSQENGSFVDASYSQMNHNGYEVHYQQGITNPEIYQEAGHRIGKTQLKYPAMAKEAYDRPILVHYDDDDPNDIVVFGWWLGCNAFGVYDYVGYIVVFDNGNLSDYTVYAF